MHINEIQTLEALLSDVQGNGILGNPRNMSGYLRSMSILAGAMASRYRQIFETEVIDEFKQLGAGAKLSGGLRVKQKLNKKELELSELELQLADFHARASSGCFDTKEEAAAALRKVAGGIELKDSELFPKPRTAAQERAWAKTVGVHIAVPTDGPESESIPSRPRHPKGAKNGRGAKVVKLRARLPA